MSLMKICEIFFENLPKDSDSSKSNQWDEKEEEEGIGMDIWDKGK